MDAISSYEYWNEIDAIASDIADEYVYAADDDGKASDVIHERVGWHQWVIYTFYHFQVLQYSENSGAIEEFGFERTTQTGALDTMLMTLCAMSADVYKRYSELGDPDRRAGYVYKRYSELGETK